MGYDLHISRRADWLEDGSDISAEEWQAYLDGSPDMRLEGYAEVVSNGGETVRVEAPDIAVWTGYPGQPSGERPVWFLHEKGQITVKSPDTEVRRKMFEVAQHFGARVQGDDGESYDQHGEVRRDMARASARPSPWWKFWR